MHSVSYCTVDLDTVRTEDLLLLTSLLRPLRIHHSGRVTVGQESHEMRRLFQRANAFPDLREQAIRNVLG